MRKKQVRLTRFNGTWVANADRIAPGKKTLIITGNARGGTSFAASAAFHLGVPFTRANPREVTVRYEHADLRSAFQARDGQAIQRISSEFHALHETWAWKLPAIQFDFTSLAASVENPHFILIFKEPTSIAFRKMDIKGADFLTALAEVLEAYERMVAFAQEVRCPVLMIGYESAMKSMPGFLDDLARYCGVENYDVSKVAAAIQADGSAYYGERLKR